MAQKKPNKTFEAKLADVEGIIEKFSHDDLALDEVIDGVEQGYELLKSMQNQITQTKEKLEKLTEKMNEEMNRNN